MRVCNTHTHIQREREREGEREREREEDLRREVCVHWFIWGRVERMLKKVMAFSMYKFEFCKFIAD